MRVKPPRIPRATCTCESVSVHTAARSSVSATAIKRQSKGKKETPKKKRGRPKPAAFLFAVLTAVLFASLKAAPASRLPFSLLDWCAVLRTVRISGARPRRGGRFGRGRLTGRLGLGRLSGRYGSGRRPCLFNPGQLCLNRVTGCELKGFPVLHGGIFTLSHLAQRVA